MLELKEGNEEDLEELNNQIMNLGYTKICGKSKYELIHGTHIKPKKEEFVSSIPDEEYENKVKQYDENGH